MKTQVGAKTYIPALLASMMLLAGSAAQATQSASENETAMMGSALVRATAPSSEARVSTPAMGSALVRATAIEDSLR